MNSQFYESLKNNILLKNTDIASLNLDEVKGQLIRVGEGEVVYREGASSNSIYLIVSGQINVIKKKVLGKAKSYIYNENEFFGNDEFFEETNRTSTAVALLDSYLIILSREEIESLMFQDNEIYLALRENLSGLFDNSTEISIEETPVAENAEPVPLEKFISGEEISEGMPAEEDIPVEEILPTINSEDIAIHIPDTETIPDEGTGTANEFELNENDIEKIETVFETKKSDEELEEENYPGLNTSDEEFIEALIAHPGDDAAGEEQIIINEKTESGFEEKPVQEEYIEPEETSYIPPAMEETAPAVEEDTLILSESDFTPLDEINKFEEPALAGVSVVNTTAGDDDTGGDMKTDEVNKIIRAMELVNSNVTIDDLLSSIVSVATDLTSADRGTLYLVDKEKGELWSKIAMGPEPKEIRLKIGEGIAGNVARTKKIENIKDVTQHPLFKKEVDKSSGYVTKNMLCFPLKNKEDEVIGVLQLLNSKNGEFSEHDEELLNMISINAAIAIQNAELVEKLLTAERVSSLGKMTNFLIQDIKKPVLVSKRYTEHLRSKSLAPDITQLVDMILTELTQVSDLVQTTSSYAEGKTILRTAVTGINAALQDFIGRIEQYVVSRKCRIDFDPDKEINVKLDSKEFYQCFMHIVKNACDAMPDGGVLKVKTKIIDKEVQIIFEDQGLGIPESFIDKIFEPFMTHGKKEGAGLGLSITKKIVEAHQGKIEARSTLGAGAEFIITLPAGASIL